MSLKAIKEAVALLGDGGQFPTELHEAATKEIAALEKAAADLTRLHLGDGVYHVRNSDRVLTDTPKGGNTWDHPDVKAWGDAAQLLATIAKEAE
jgi:hypothetical protein